MSLGSITSATNVTFDGGRIVLDVDRFFTGEDGGGKVQMSDEEIAQTLNIRTNDKDNVVLGYTGYKDGEFDANQQKTFSNITVVNEKNEVIEGENSVRGYMWVEDLDQLQKIAENDNLDGWYALRNSIDANYTASGSYDSGLDNGTTGLGFKPIGEYNANAWGSADPYEDAFKGRFDGLGYSIFGLNIRRDSEDGVGLFGAVHGDNAAVRNLILNGGSIAGGDNVGSVAGRVAGRRANSKKSRTPRTSREMKTSAESRARSKVKPTASPASQTSSTSAKSADISTSAA